MTAYYPKQTQDESLGAMPYSNIIGLPTMPQERIYANPREITTAPVHVLTKLAGDAVGAYAGISPLYNGKASVHSHTPTEGMDPCPVNIQVERGLG